MPMIAPVDADVFVPAHHRGLLDRHTGLDPPVAARNVAIGLVLALEQLDARHRDDAGADALGLQRLVGRRRRG